jgi:hypothetical protein
MLRVISTSIQLSVMDRVENLFGVKLGGYSIALTGSIFRT